MNSACVKDTYFGGNGLCTAPIYETMFSGNGRSLVRTIGTQAGASGRNINFQGDDEDDDDSQTFTLLNSFWFMIASLLQQGTDLLPR